MVAQYVETEIFEEEDDIGVFHNKSWNGQSATVIMITVQTLYESSIAFGIRKALQAEQGKTDMENYIAKLEEEKVIRSIVNI